VERGIGRDAVVSMRGILAGGELASVSAFRFCGGANAGRPGLVLVLAALFEGCCGEAFGAETEPEPISPPMDERMLLKNCGETQHGDRDSAFSLLTLMFEVRQQSSLLTYVKSRNHATMKLRPGCVDMQKLSLCSRAFGYGLQLVESRLW